MNSPIFDAFNAGNQAKQPGNPLFYLLNNLPNGREAMSRVQQIMEATKQSPQQIVMGMLQSGRVTQDQYDRASQLANMITGRKF